MSMKKWWIAIVCMVLFTFLGGISGGQLHEAYGRGEILDIQDGTLVRCRGGEGEIVVPSGVRTIGHEAFHESPDVTSIVLPETVTRIEEDAFFELKNLKSVNIPKGVTYIGSQAFAGTGITNIVIPDGVTSIEHATFINCGKLEHVTLGSGITRIDQLAFSGTGLISIDIPSSVTTIGGLAFGGCEKLVSISLTNHVREIQDNSLIDFGSEIPYNRVIYFAGTFDEWCNLNKLYRLPKELWGRYVDRLVCFSGESKELALGSNWNKYQSNVWYVGKKVTTASSNWLSDSSSIVVTSVGKLINKTEGMETTANITASIGPLKQTITVTSDKKSDVYVQDIQLQAVGDALEIPIYSIKAIVYGVFPANATNKDVEIVVSDPSVVSITHEPTVNWILIEGTKAGNTEVSVRSKDGHVNKQITVTVINKENGNKIGKRAYGFLDSWFNGKRSSEVKEDYNEFLAQFCSYFCMYGYRDVKTMENGKEVKKGDAEELRRQLSLFGFELMDTNINKIDFVNGRDEVKYFIAKRDKRSIGGKVFIFAGFIGSYGWQWHSNFDPIGKESHGVDIKDMPLPIVHSGFNDARIFVERKIEKQIKELGNYNREDLVCIFTGHSRGAATANLVAADFIRGARTNVLRSEDMASMNYTIPDNVYAYTFATPNNILVKAEENDIHSAKYDRIYNIVNPEDFVTYMIPEKWGYSKYGTTYQMPTYNASTDVYCRYFYTFLDYYDENCEQVTKEDTDYMPYLGDKVVTDFVNEMVTGCSSIVELYTKTDYIVDSKKQHLFSYYDYFQSVLTVAAYKGVPDPIYALRGDKLPGKPTSYFIANQLLLPYFGSAHQMETYDALIYAFPKYSYQNVNETIKVSARCPVNIEVIKNDTDEVVARIVNNIVDTSISSKDGAIHVYIEGDNKVVYLPNKDDYMLRIIGNDEGVLDIVKTTYDVAGHEIERKCCYSIPVSEQYELEYQIIKDEKDEEDSDSLISMYGTTAADIKEIPLEKKEVQLDIEGEGCVWGHGKYTSADYVSVFAEPEEGYHFVGWYLDGDLVSEDATYYFTVKDDVRLIAKFACNHDYVVTITNPSYVLVGKRDYVCSRCGGGYEETIPRLDLPFTDVKKTGWQASTVRFMLDNLLMSGVSATKFAPDSIMNRGQLVAILWNMEGKPKVSGTLAFTDVPTTNTFYKAILWASQNKVINGYANGTFGPKDSLTRQQIATILMNYAKYRGVTLENNADLSSFKDAANVSKAMVTSMQWAVGNKIISGKSSGTLLDPKGVATRIEVAAMVMNYCKNIG